VEFLAKYVVVLVLAICLCLGYIIKNSISFIPNKYIPLIMAIVGTILNVWLNGWKFTPEILLGGMASGLASTGTYEMIRNITLKEETAEKPVEKPIENPVETPAEK
jgi:protein-S-isoprenylcysteine O-methyltransferase Ste14